MPDIEVALNYALAQTGKPYRTWGHRFGPDYFDCSGLVIRALDEAGIPLPNGISAENEWGNSVSIYNWAKNVGGLISVEEAIRTRGAILIRGRWYGYGPMGDVKFSLGNGLQTGAGSRRTGVATRSVFTDFFHDGFVIPDVSYGSIPPITPPKPKEQEDMIIVAPGWQTKDRNRPACARLDLETGQVGMLNGARVSQIKPPATTAVVPVPPTSSVKGWFETFNPDGSKKGFKVIGSKDASGNPAYEYTWIARR